MRVASPINHISNFENTVIFPFDEIETLLGSFNPTFLETSFPSQCYTENPEHEVMIEQLSRELECDNCTEIPSNSSDSSQTYQENLNSATLITTTPTNSSPESYSPQNNNNINNVNNNRFQPYKRKPRRRGEKPISEDKSRVAKQRMRDPNGKFIKKDVSMKIEELESKLLERELECDRLKQSLFGAMSELEILRFQLSNQNQCNSGLAISQSAFFSAFTSH